MKCKFYDKMILYISLLFFLSGMCGLVYQVLWTRILSLLFGHTTLAVGTVVSAFMGGLALGANFFGKWSDKRTRSFHLPVAYGLMEAAIGIFALFSPFLFKMVEIIYLNVPDGPLHQRGIVRFLLCFSTLIVPTFLMGGTLPLLSRFFIRQEKDVNRILPLLYWVNTIGAATGAFIAGFFLIRYLGIMVTLELAAFANIFVAILAIIIALFYNKHLTTTASETTIPQMHEQLTNHFAPMSFSKKLICIIFALTGFASMIYEICWTRALTLTMGSSTYAFSAILTTFLIGIAGGSFAYNYLIRKVHVGMSAFGWTEMLIGMFCLLTVPLLEAMPTYFIIAFPYVKNFYNLIIFTDFLISFFIMIIPTFLMGFAFPLVVGLFAQESGVTGESIGSIYAVNTLGCIIGALATSFAMIPLLGLQTSLLGAVIINICCGTVILLYFHSRKRLVITCALFLIAVIFFMPKWNPAIMSIGPAIYAGKYQGANFGGMIDKSQVLYYKDGISASVAVLKHGETISLKINGKADASNAAADMPTQLLLGYLPLLYHHAPRDVFVIGLGSGVTLRAVTDFPEIRSVVCAELEPAVIEASRFFSSVNKNVPDLPKVKVVIDDGRNLLLASPQRYDVIISEPSNPWISGIASLYTADFYRLSKSHLRPSGVFCQWFQLYGMSTRDLKMVIKTFFSVFPNGHIWQGADADLLLIGMDRDTKLDFQRITKMYDTNSNFRSSLQGIGIKGADCIFAKFITDKTTLSAFYNQAPLNTDDLPLLEFSAPRNIYTDTALDNIKMLYAYKNAYLPELINYSPDRKLSPEFFATILQQVKDIPFRDKVRFESSIPVSHETTR